MFIDVTDVVVVFSYVVMVVCCCFVVVRIVFITVVAAFDVFVVDVVPVACALTFVSLKMVVFFLICILVSDKAYFCNLILLAQFSKEQHITNNKY